LAVELAKGSTIVLDINLGATIAVGELQKASPDTLAGGLLPVLLEAALNLYNNGQGWHARSHKMDLTARQRLRDAALWISSYRGDAQHSKKN